LLPVPESTHVSTPTQPGARTALAKVAAALPKDKRATLEGSPLFSPGLFANPQFGARMDSLRAAIDTRRYVLLSYQDAKDVPSERRVRALALAFCGDTWTFGSWCELGDDFRWPHTSRSCAAR
jgi:predicted DNA-binding transcriptional regulator YafY